MGFVDLMVLGTLLAGLVFGYLRGFLTQVTGLVGMLGGLYLAERYHGVLSERVLSRWIESEHTAAIAFLLIAGAGLVATGLVVWGVRRAVANFELGTYDRFLGGVFGGLKATLLCAGILLVLVAFSPGDGSIASAIGASRSGPILWGGMDRAARLLPGAYAQRFGDYLDRNRPPEPSTQEPPAPAPEPRLQVFPEPLPAEPPGSRRLGTPPQPGTLPPADSYPPADRQLPPEPDES